MNGMEEKFIDALRELEANENADQVVELFAEDCEVGNTTIMKSLKGEEGAREFWTTYRKTFGEIKSTFRNKVVSDGVAALEWVSEGTSRDGNEINYEGVSVLESDGDKIKRFYAYFNPSKLGHEIEGRQNG